MHGMVEECQKQNKTKDVFVLVNRLTKQACQIDDRGERQNIDQGLIDCEMVDILCGNAPTYIDDMLQPVSGLDRQTILWSASKGDLIVPRTRLKFGERAFRVAAPWLWNELPSDIRKASTLATFKNILRHSYSANTMALSSNNNNTVMFFVVLLLFLILICFYYVYCTLLSLSIVLLHVCM